MRLSQCFSTTVLAAGLFACTNGSQHTVQNPDQPAKSPVDPTLDPALNPPPNGTAFLPASTANGSATGSNQSIGGTDGASGNELSGSSLPVNNLPNSQPNTGGSMPPPTAGLPTLPLPSPSGTPNIQPPPTNNQQGATNSQTNPPASNQSQAVEPPATSAQSAGQRLKVNDLSLQIPPGMQLSQNGAAGGTVFLAFTAGDEKNVTLYSRPAPAPSLETLFACKSRVEQGDISKKVGNHTWRMLESSKANGKTTWYVTGFLLEQGGFVYYGYARSKSQESARAHVNALLEVID